MRFEFNIFKKSMTLDLLTRTTRTTLKIHNCPSLFNYRIMRVVAFHYSFTFFNLGVKSIRFMKTSSIFILQSRGSEVKGSNNLSISRFDINLVPSEQNTKQGLGTKPFTKIQF